MHNFHWARSLFFSPHTHISHNIRHYFTFVWKIEFSQTIRVDFCPNRLDYIPPPPSLWLEIFTHPPFSLTLNVFIFFFYNFRQIDSTEPAKKSGLFPGDRLGGRLWDGCGKRGRVPSSPVRGRSRRGSRATRAPTGDATRINSGETKLSSRGHLR